MLILSRRLGEQIVIDRNIELTVVAIHGQRVQLGVRAPKDVAVHRKEIVGRRDSGRQLSDSNRATQGLPECMKPSCQSRDDAG